MGRKKRVNPLKRWLSASPDCRENRFIQVGDTLLHDERFKKLGASACKLYFCCAMESAGEREFQMPLSKAAKYGFSESTFRRALDELESGGFIQTIRSGKNTRTASDYQFSFKWLEE